MSDCSLELRQQGKAYPRTCRMCGIGRCLKGLVYEGPAKVACTETAQPWSPASTNAVIQRLPIPAALTDVLNSHCAENGSNTPDFILGDFLASVLECLNQAIRERDKWYGVSHRPGETQQSEVEFLRKALDQAIEVSQCVIYTTTEAALRISPRDDIEVKLIACSLNSIRKVEDYPELAEYLRKPVSIEGAKEGS